MANPLDVDTLLSQGACCGNGCANCPYVDEQGKRHQIGVGEINAAWVQFKKQNPAATYEDWKLMQAK